MISQVDRDDPVTIGQATGDIAPAAARSEQAVQEHHRLSGSMGFEGEAHVSVPSDQTTPRGPLICDR